jgi:PTS system mannose-specific IIA component
MSVAVMLITHGRLSQNLVDTLTEMLGGQLSLTTEVLEVRSVQDPDLLIRQGARIAQRLDQGDGVLILTDAFGSTPSNIANRIADTGRCRVVAGLNVPMLIKVFNYPGLKLDALAQAAVEGGQRGIVLCAHHAKETLHEA